jgi:pimeloyl-ACP methyl ester carboxylesterase
MTAGTSTLDTLLNDGLTSTLRQVLRRSLESTDDVAMEYLGAPLDEFARRFPTFVRGSILQSMACYQTPATFTHSGGPALMLVPGLFCTPSIFNALGKELEALGIDVYVPRPFPFYHGVLANTGPAERSARMLVEDLEQLRENGVQRIALAGHSLGGVVVLTALELAETEHRTLPEISTVIALAAPLEGAPIARLLSSLIPACRDLVPGSAIMQRIAQLSGRVATTLVSTADSLVPAHSQRPARAASVVMEGFQHMDFYVGGDEKVQRTARALAAALQPAVHQE